MGTIIQKWYLVLGNYWALSFEYSLSGAVSEVEGVGSGANCVDCALGEVSQVVVEGANPVYSELTGVS